jgi:hypothetical protein
MSTRKTRTLFATLATALAVVVMPASSNALVAKPTGDRALDSYCQQAAALIDKAMTQGNLALVNGDDAGAAAWYALADDMISRSEANGCEFGAARKIRRLRRFLAAHPNIEPIQISPEQISGGTSPEGGARYSPGGDSPTLGPIAP